MASALRLVTGTPAIHGRTLALRVSVIATRGRHIVPSAFGGLGERPSRIQTAASAWRLRPRRTNSDRENTLLDRV
jgi:hypothetical protein